MFINTIKDNYSYTVNKYTYKTNYPRIILIELRNIHY